MGEFFLKSKLSEIETIKKLYLMNQSNAIRVIESKLQSTPAPNLSHTSISTCETKTIAMINACQEIASSDKAVRDTIGKTFCIR